MEEEKKVSYKGYGDIIFNNEEDIAYYKTSQEFELTQALLLGYYDEKGDYTISDDICKELVGLDKLIDETSHDKYYISARAGDYKLKFEVVVETKENKKVAYLYLKENLSVSGILEKKFSTLIASYIDDDDINFLFRMKKAFNIFARIEAEGKDMSNSDKSGKILALKKALLDKRNKLYYERDNLDKSYVKEILSILKSAGPGGKRLLLMYLDAIRNKNLNKLKVNKYVTLRQVLDLLMQNAMVEGYFPDKNMRQIKKKKKKQMETSKKLQVDYSANAIKKSGGKSKGGGGAKKGKGKSGGGGGKPKASKKAPPLIIPGGLPSDVFTGSEKEFSANNIQSKANNSDKKLFNSISSLKGLANQTVEKPKIEEDRTL